MQGNPSVRPFPGFNANMDAESLRKAMKGLGCNNSQVIAVLCARTAWQRQEIAKAFKVMYGKDLIKVNSKLLLSKYQNFNSRSLNQNSMAISRN